MSASSPKPEDDSAGFALVAVLLFLLLVTAVVAPFALSAKTNWLVVSNRQQHERLDLLADAILTLVAIRQSSSGDAATAQQLFPLNSTPVRCEISGYLITVGLQDQTGLIDLNAADTVMLGVGIQALGISPEQASEIANAIVGYRNYEPEAASQKRSIEIFGGNKGGPFEAVIELSDFRPLRDIPDSDLYRTFTVHSKLGIVDRSHAPDRLSALLKAVGILETGAVNFRSPTAIFVTVQDARTAFRGYSGFLIEPSARSDRPFRRIEKLTAPRIDAAEAQSRFPCPAQFVNDVGRLLAGANS